MSWLQYFLPITPLVPSLVKATRSFRVPFMLFAQKIFRPELNRQGGAHQRKRRQNLV